MNKLPAFQFYPADWRKDTGVQSLSYHDRGVWFEILCLMHESEERGKLTLNGHAMPEEALAQILGLDKQILTTTLTTLLTYGVASRDEVTGALVCRRMVRDEKLRQIRTEAGKRGGNPILVKQNPTTPVNQIPTPSSSSSSSEKKESRKESSERLSDSAQPNADQQRGKVKPRSRRPQVPDEAWLDELSLNPAYAKLPVKMIYGKMLAWCELKGKQPTRARLLNWLNREEQPLTGVAVPATKPNPNFFYNPREV